MPLCAPQAGENRSAPLPDQRIQGFRTSRRRRRRPAGHGARHETRPKDSRRGRRARRDEEKCFTESKKDRPQRLESTAASTAWPPRWVHEARSNGGWGQPLQEAAKTPRGKFGVSGLVARTPHRPPPCHPIPQRAAQGSLGQGRSRGPAPEGEASPRRRRTARRSCGGGP